MIDTIRVSELLEASMDDLQIHELQRAMEGFLPWDKVKVEVDGNEAYVSHVTREGGCLVLMVETG